MVKLNRVVVGGWSDWDVAVAFIVSTFFITMDSLFNDFMILYTKTHLLVIQSCIFLIFNQKPANALRHKAND